MLNKNNFINLSENKYYVKIKFIIIHISLVTKTLIHDGNVRTVLIENNDTLWVSDVELFILSRSTTSKLSEKTKSQAFNILETVFYY